MPVTPVSEEALKVTSQGTAERFVQTYAPRVTFSQSSAQAGQVTLNIARVPGEDRADMLTSLAKVVDADRGELLKLLDVPHEQLPLTREQFDRMQAFCGDNRAVKEGGR